MIKEKSDAARFVVTSKYPIPDKVRSAIPGKWSVFANMKVGDSFAVGEKDYHNARAAIPYWRNRCKIELVMARDDSGAWRIWRTK